MRLIGVRFIAAGLVTAAALGGGIARPAAATPGICASVYIDSNGNGVWEEGEAFARDWEVCVTDANGREDCRWTDEDGAACWMLIPQGGYLVCETLQNGWQNTSPLCQELDLEFEVAQVFFGNRTTEGPTGPTDRVVSGTDGSAPGAAFQLAQNAPNPFSASTSIRFVLTEPSAIRLSIHDAAGRVVRAIDREDLPAGSHAIEWDGLAEDGARLPSGVYFYRLVAGDRAQSRSMLLLP
jgi:hypothetical protein